MTYQDFLQFLEQKNSNETNETNETVELTDDQKMWYYHEQEMEERAYFEDEQY